MLFRSERSPFLLGVASLSVYVLVCLVPSVCSLLYFFSLDFNKITLYSWRFLNKKYTYHKKGYICMRDEQNIHTRVAETLAEEEAFDPRRRYKIEKCRR